jgi:hypothetical protein
LSNREVNNRSWFSFIEELKNYAMSNSLEFEPTISGKNPLDKRNTKDLSMYESSLYGSTRSSYQTLENTKIIIRHSKRIQEESPNSRTRNIQAIYVESADGERFRYPFIHLAGARAMQRHVANNGNPYDGFGQYIVSLSEQVYNLRRFNHLVGRTAFVENTQVVEIASAAKKKATNIKKTLERIHKQSGYDSIKENFSTFVKHEIDPEVMEMLKNRFTIQKFNEELIDLFPYITDLLKEEDDVAPTGWDNPKDNVSDLENAINSAPQIEIEPYSKDFIQKAMDITHKQIKGLEDKARENPGDKKIQYSLEKASARMGLLQARLATAEPKADDVITKNAQSIEHLSTHVKDDNISLLLSRISDEYGDMPKEKQKKVVELIKLLKSKQKLVSPFASESTSYEELESMLGNDESVTYEEFESEQYNPVQEYLTRLENVVDEKSNLLSTDAQLQQKSLEELNKLMTDHFPVGTNGINAIESLKGIIDDPTLNDKFKQMAQKDADTCARSTIMDWIRENAPDLESQIDTGNMDSDPKNPQQAEPDQAAQTQEPQGEPEVAPEQPTEETDEEEHNPQEIEEFVRSLYDATTGKFPRGEEGVKIAVEKKFGDAAGMQAEAIIQGLKGEFDENIFRMKKLAGIR